jgi:hypothetical protein
MPWRSCFAFGAVVPIRRAARNLYG